MIEKKNTTLKDNRRKKVIETALEFANITWTPTENNLFHGCDTDETLVNTPDVNYAGAKYDKCGWWRVGKPNQGMAYNWGGFSTIEEFRKGISEGKYAGNVPDSRDNKTSLQCVGVDCSGLVSICWGLQRKQSTKSLPSVASKLDKIENLLLGDVLLVPGSHVMIFVEFTDGTKSAARIIDATRSTGKVSSRIVQIAELIDEGYAGYRYDEDNK